MTLSRSLLAAAAVAALSAPSFADDAAPPKSGKYWVYIGTYTAKDGSKGVYRCELDAATGKLTAPELAAEADSPSFLHVALDGKTLYSVGEADGKDGGGVYSWPLDAATGKLGARASLTSKGAGPCFIATDAENKFAVVANYGGGSTSVFKLKADGALDARTGFIQHEGKVFDVKRQGGPHAHSAAFSPDGKLLMVADLGLDKIMLHDLDRTTGEIKPHDPAFIKVPDRCGPRHFRLAPSGDVAFVCGEIDLTVNVVKLDLAGGKSAVVQSLSTLPEGVKATPKDSTAECLVHPSGKFVYVSNREHDTVAAFAYDAKAMKLTPVGHITGDIKVPRNFNVTPCGKWMLVASQDGKRVGVYAIDEKTGLAKETDNFVTVVSPVCVKFLAKP